MTDITELAQSHELLIANGQQTADLLRHLADNEIDSDYFAVVSECESYGQETDAELSITEFAIRAAGYVDELVEALEKAQETISFQQGEIKALLSSLESRTVTVSKSDIFNVPGGETYVGGEMISVDTLCLYLAEQGIKWEAE